MSGRNGLGCHSDDLENEENDGEEADEAVLLVSRHVNDVPQDGARNKAGELLDVNLVGEQTREDALFGGSWLIPGSPARMSQTSR